MSRDTSLSLGKYFEKFVEDQVQEGRYKSRSEVVRAGLRLLEKEESEKEALKKAIKQGVESGKAQDFNPENNLKALKDLRKVNG